MGRLHAGPQRQWTQSERVLGAVSYVGRIRGGPSGSFSPSARWDQRFGLSDEQIGCIRRWRDSSWRSVVHYLQPAGGNFSLISSRSAFLSFHSFIYLSFGHSLHRLLSLFPKVVIVGGLLHLLLRYFPYLRVAPSSLHSSHSLTIRASHY